jgi:oxygen-independent coproporphyrinogen-3 oxidase
MYTKALLREMENRAEQLQGVSADSLFLGGGTPSLLHVEWMDRIMEGVHRFFYMEEDAEITIEANPGTLSPEKLKAYGSFGVNRVSLGVQSFDDAILAKLGRIHTGQEAIRSYEMARTAGFDNINMDLMFGIPGQSQDVWEITLKEAFRCSPEHLSMYGLSIEKGTKFWQWMEEKNMAACSDALDRQMYHRGLDLAGKRGFEQYEISNLAKPGKECAHNMKYWNFSDYLGLGLGAHSFIQGTRIENTAHWDSYIQGNWVNQQHVNSWEDSVSEFIFTGLRQVQGIRYADFRSLFEVEFQDYLGSRMEKLEAYVQEGYVVENRDGLCLTRKGMDFSNPILADLI